MEKPETQRLPEIPRRFGGSCDNISHLQTSAENLASVMATLKIFETPKGSCSDRIKTLTHRWAILADLGPCVRSPILLSYSLYAFKVPTVNQTLSINHVIRVSTWPKMINKVDFIGVDLPVPRRI